MQNKNRRCDAHLQEKSWWAIDDDDL